MADTCVPQTLPGDGVGPTYYGPNKTAVGLDLWMISAAVASATIAIAGLFTIFSFESKADAVRKTVGLLFGVYIMFTLLFCNFAYNWQYGEVQTRTPYAGYDSHEVEVTLGIKIGLRGFNVTMLGEPEYQLGQRINYNEQFLWGRGNVWFQGRVGFSDLGNTVARTWRRAQFGGMPLPILQIAEYFTIDGEQIRWLRYYRYAGYYTHIMMYTGLGVYFLSVLFGAFRPRVGALLLMLVAALMASAVIIYSSVVNRIKNPLMIPWRDGVLVVNYSWSFILTAVTSGVLFFGAMLLYLHHTAQLVRRKRNRGEKRKLGVVEVWVCDHLGDMLEFVFGRAGSDASKLGRPPSREQDVSCLCGTCDSDDCTCVCHDVVEERTWTKHSDASQPKPTMQKPDTGLMSFDYVTLGDDENMSSLSHSSDTPVELQILNVLSKEGSPRLLRPQSPPQQRQPERPVTARGEDKGTTSPPPANTARFAEQATYLDSGNAVPPARKQPSPLPLPLNLQDSSRHEAPTGSSRSGGNVG
ncbi:Dual oxidase maturation factor 1 [Porphyridium purpureum]|uniref:Dual oxidase maturation factor 1 n=1 Tax=Porphyridium purpureum TaxID=35688 RepID=A0A5J4YSB2_PORPP|nr:Dual oxidase maturation factor 1 [Porphyridium purpureum]|eukprot:POR5008..scf236_6